jgi:2-methylcitrate dehydratase PrpD
MNVADLIPALLGRSHELVSSVTTLDAKIALADLIACGVAGPSVPIGDGSPGGHLIWSTGELVEKDVAVRHNTFDSHSSDWDSIHYLTHGHPALVLFGNLLAGLEAKRWSASDVLQGYVVGVEVMSVLGCAFGVDLRTAGFHPTTVLGAVTAAIVESWMTGGDADEIEAAAQIAAGSIGGTTSSFGGIGKPFQVSVAPGVGRWAAEVARAKKPRLVGDWWDPIQALCPSSSSVSTWTFGPPAALSSVSTLIKRRTVCAYFDQTLDHLERVRGVDVPSRVVVEVPDWVLLAHLEDCPNDLDTARFSLTHLAAAALLGVDLTGDLGIHRPDVAKLREQVRLELLPGVVKVPGDKLVGRCIIDDVQGRRISFVEHGIEPHILDWPMVERKVRDCVQVGLNRSDGVAGKAAQFVDFMKYFEEADGVSFQRAVRALVAP